MAEGLKASPNFTLSNCSTRPVHDPHDAEALVWERTSSTLLRPSFSIAPVIFPLHMPLQPQISASSGKAATAAVGSRGVPPWYDWPKIRVSRISEISTHRFSISKNQAPSEVSP